MNKASAAAGDLTNTSPTEDSMLVSDGGPDDPDGTRHILITSDHGDAHTIRLGLYYGAGAGNDGSKTFRILGGDTTRCRYTRNHGGAGGEINASRDVVRVRFVTYNANGSVRGSDSQVYDYGQMCNTNDTTRSRDITIPASIINNAPVDDTTNNRYRRVTAIIEHVDGMKTAADPNVDGTTTFKVRAFGARVGLVDTAESINEPNNSYVARRGYANTDRTIRLEIPFGLDCTQGSRPNAEVVVFDADNGPNTIKTLYFYIQRNNAAGNWVTLTRGNSGDTVHARANVSVDADGRITPGYMPSGNRAFAEISHMRANTKYRIVVRDLYMANFNYIYVGMPGDSIFGTDAINCVLRASPTLDINPDVSPDYIEVGGNFTAVAGIRNQGTATVRLQYNHQIWYGTGNDGYSAGQGDGSLQETGWQDRDVGAGNTVNVHTYTRNNISPPANARYVCSSMNIRNQPLEEAEIISNPIVKCTPIGKSPSFAVTAGGVRTGGNYGSGTCSVAKPGGAITTDGQLSHYFGITAHDYSNNDSLSPHHTYVRDSALSLGYISNVVSKLGGVGSGVNTELHFARGPGNPQPPATVVGGGLFYGSSGSSPDAGVFPRANPVNTHCLTDLFEANRYPADTTPVSVPSSRTESLPAPVAGVNAITYNVCGTAANTTMLTLTGPGGGELVLQSGQQYVVRVTQCDANPVYVKIASNIRYAGTNMRADQLPQFVFLAGTAAGSRVSIHVDNSVTRLDGIYANRGIGDRTATFLTCAQRANPADLRLLQDVSITDCSNELRINGAVVLGGRLHPYRTFGHHNNANKDPAEVFNLRPDTILSDYARDRSSSQLQVVNQRELAPRF